MPLQRFFLVFTLSLALLAVSCSRTELSDFAFRSKENMQLGDVHLVNRFGNQQVKIGKQRLPLHTVYSSFSQKVQKVGELPDGRLIVLSEGNLYLFDGNNEIKLIENELISDFELDTISRNIFVSSKKFIAILNPSAMTEFDVNYIVNDTLDFKDFNKTEQTPQFIYFIGESAIVEYDKSKNEVSNYFTFPIGYTQRESFVLDGALYVNIYPKGIYRFQAKGFVEKDPEWGLFNYAEQKIYENPAAFVNEVEATNLKYLGKFDENHSLLVLGNKFVLFNGTQFALLHIFEQFDIENLVTGNAISFNDSILAISTLNKGILLLHKKSGELILRLNDENAGLTAYSKVLIKDRQNGLWVSQNNSFQRWHFDLPLRELELDINGAEVNILHRQNNSLFIGTNEGAFVVSGDSLLNSKRVIGLQTGIFQFISYQDKILAIGNNAVFEISQEKVKELFQLQVIRQVAYSEKLQTLFIATNDGLFVYNDTIETPQRLGLNLQLDIFSLAVHQDSLLWLGLYDKVLYAKLKDSLRVERFYSLDMPLQVMSAVNVYSTKSKFFLRHANTNYFVQHDSLIADTNLFRRKIYRAFESEEILENIDNQWRIGGVHSYQTQNLNQLNLIGIIRGFVSWDNHLLVAEKNKLYYLNLADSVESNNANLMVNRIQNSDNQFVSKINTKIRAYTEGIRMHLSHPFYFKEFSLQYQYYIEGVSGQWSAWSNNAVVEIPFLPTGSYKIHFRAKDILGRQSAVFFHQVQAVAPFYARTWFILAMILMLVAIVSLLVYWFMKMSSQQIMEENRILEKRISERTEELRKKQEEITDSIRYASRIQRAILPSLASLNAFGIDHFLINKPKNMVSGDFYWLESLDAKIYFALADSTGHGVPGAFMSILGISLLNHLKIAERNIPVNQVLNDLRTELIASLKQSVQEIEVHDGIDMALVCIDTKLEKIYFSGAFRPLYFVHHAELMEIKAQRQPIGWYVKQKDFELQEIDYQKGDILYLFTDGFVDQTDMQSSQKFSTARFKELIISIADKPLHIQKNILEEELKNWKKKAIQVDDILLAALKL